MHKEHLELLKSNELFLSLPIEKLTPLTQTTTIKHCKKGHNLFTQDENAAKAFIVISGWVKLYRHTIEGEEYIIDVLTKGHIFGENAIFHQNTYSYGAEIIEDASLLAIPLTILKDYLDNIPGFASEMLAFQARQQVKLEKNREHLVIQNAPQRIGCFLLQLLPLNPVEPYVLHLPYDKTLLAARLGMQRETFSRALGLLQKEELITLQSASITIPNVQNMIKFSCVACTSHYPCTDHSNTSH